MASNRILTSLNLSNNSFGNATGKALADVLEVATGLRSLALGGNALPAATVTLLSKKAGCRVTLAFGDSSESESCNWCKHCRSQLVRKIKNDCGHMGYEGRPMSETTTITCTECLEELHYHYEDTGEEGDGQCFAGDATVRLAEGGTLPVHSLTAGARVFTPSGPATVLCALRCDVSERPARLVALPDGGPHITPGHPVLLPSGTWCRAASLGTPSVLEVDAVYNFVLSSGHILEIDGWLCVTLGDGRDDLRDQLGPSRFSSPAAALQLLHASAAFEGGRITKAAFRRGNASLTASRQAGAISAILRLPAHERRLSLQLLCAFHRAAMEETDVSSEIRQEESVAIGTHTPPVGPEVERLTEAFCKSTDEAWRTWATHDAAAFALWWINHVHPFLDGNGRTARCVAYLILCAAGEATADPPQLQRFHQRFGEAPIRRKYVTGLSLADGRAAAADMAMPLPASTVAELALLLRELCSPEDMSACAAVGQAA